MIKEIRKRINSSYNNEIYKRYSAELADSIGSPPDFRLSETPVFLTKQLTDELVKAGDEIALQVSNFDYTQYARHAIADIVDVPDKSSHPEYIQIDFGIIEKNGAYYPKLIELQGFPSIYGFQYFQERAARKVFNIPDELDTYFNGFNSEAYVSLLKEIIVGDHSTENVILLEIEPETQKTKIDFAATTKLTGIDAVCITSICKIGKELFYNKNGREIKIERIYNRVILDELLRKDITPPFNFNEELSVEWSPHPNWFNRLSKITLPYLKSSYAPESFFLSDIEKIPDNLSQYVLKPIYSFAGLGVDLDPTREKLELIKDKENYILQEKVEYANLIETLDEPAKIEVRLMYFWNKKPVLVNNLVRMSKGKMMGVDFNKYKTWVGSSLAFHP